MAKGFKKLSVLIIIAAIIMSLVGVNVINTRLKTPKASAADNNFLASESPEFMIDLGEDQTSTDDVKIVKTQVLNASGQPTNILAIARKNSEGIAVNVPKDSNFKPGKYEVQVTYEKNGEILTYNQEFTWGVLAINPDKSIYLPAEEALIGMAVLDDFGRMVCDAEVDLEIISPKGSKNLLSTADGQIKISPECEVYGVTDLPDYYTEYIFNQTGTYILRLTANTANGVKTIEDKILVMAESVDFDVQRTGPTRIYPLNKDWMRFTILANQDYSGPIIESVPASFEITSQPGLTITTVNDIKKLTWQANLVKGKTYNFNYEFDAPDVSPEFYVLGPLTIGGWQENRQWQIASDAAPSYRATGVMTDRGPGTTCAHPAGIQTNDIMIAFIETGGQAVSMDAGAGEGTWTEVTNSRQTSGNAYLVAYWSRYDGSQIAPSTTDSGDHNSCVVVAFYGVKTSGTPYNISAGGTEASDQTGSIPGATTSIADTLVVVALATDLPDETAVNKFSGWANADLTGIGEAADETHKTGDGGGTAVAYGAYGSVGTYDPTAVTLVDAAVKAMVSIALEPPPVNNLPTIESYEDYPDPIYNQNDITFWVDWNDADAEDNRIFICDADSADQNGCTGGTTWCSTTLASTDPVSCTYTTRSEQIATSPNAYYAFTCDDEGCVATSGAGTFTVLATSTASMIIKGGMRFLGGVRLR
jgi:hypothetical protein